DIRKWVLMDFMAGERDGWLARLLDAIAGEVDRLAAHDEGGFMSRVAHLAPARNPAPGSDTQDRDGKEETV
ncbi:MAG: aminoacyl-tRNA hydrolase, partial [Candidatus Puniceispirillaceae bacterium]